MIFFSWFMGIMDAGVLHGGTLSFFFLYIPGDTEHGLSTTGKVNGDHGYKKVTRKWAMKRRM
jgi:hypothetical protein